ncbi:MAG: hypothetical protein KC635_08520 [Myxococcales bacterium]|nr:hypothetical protein [Myxococcales bacterium]MCB9732221.1 hypothetical protein [Deltaproteobacteria bacterium]
MPLSALVEALGRGLDRLDEGFARGFARTLAERAAHVRLPAIDALALDDVVATLYMDRSLRLVVTGTLRGGPGAVSVRFDEADFPHVAVALHRRPVDEPYTFATLDFSWRGRVGWLREAAPPLPAGQKVVVRALATIGGDAELRVTALGMERSVRPDVVAFDEEEIAS